MIIKHKVAEIDLTGKSWDEVCNILNLFQGIRDIPIYWEPDGFKLILGVDEDGKAIIKIVK